jgi:hypothetical protein
MFVATAARIALPTLVRYQFEAARKAEIGRTLPGTRYRCRSE